MKLLALGFCELRGTISRSLEAANWELAEVGKQPLMQGELELPAHLQGKAGFLLLDLKLGSPIQGLALSLLQPIPMGSAGQWLGWSRGSLSPP